MATKIKRFHGPRQASFTVRWSDSRGLSSYGNAAGALGEVAYYRAAGRDAAPRVTCTELCTVPGCDGWGNVTVRGRAGQYRDTPCPQHAPATEHDLVEVG